MWNKSLIEGDFALLQSVGGDSGCDSSEPAFQTAGMKHAIGVGGPSAPPESPSTI